MLKQIKSFVLAADEYEACKDMLERMATEKYWDLSEEDIYYPPLEVDDTLHVCEALGDLEEGYLAFMQIQDHEVYWWYMDVKTGALMNEEQIDNLMAGA